MEPEGLDRLRDAAAALNVAAHAHPDEFDSGEVRGRATEVDDALEALDGEPSRDGRVGRDVVADALNAAGAAAYLEVCEYAGRFRRREEYRPLEDLAGRVWQSALEAGAEAARRA